MEESFVIGHEKIIKFLNNMVKEKRVPHALIFSGKEGIGKKRVALIFSAMLLCKKGEGCLSCGNCKRVVKLIHPDVVIIEPTKETITISQIRELQDWASLCPMEKKAKIAIIDNAHLMTREASNAFLKTLEEPPADTFFVLITHAVNKLISTIVSRCLVLRFPDLSQECVEEICKREKITGLQKKIAVETGSFAFSEISEDRLEKLFALSEAVITKRDKDLLFFTDYLSESRKEPEKKLFYLFLFLLRKRLNQYMRLREEQELFELHEVLSFVEETVYNYNVNLRSLFEYLIIKRCQ